MTQKIILFSHFGILRAIMKSKGPTFWHISELILVRKRIKLAGILLHELCC